MDILEFIPTGSENAVTRGYLCVATGLTDRKVRILIHEARRKIPILNLQNSRGYFIPDMNSEYDKRLLVRYVRQEESRLKSIGWALKSARQTLKNCNIDWRKDVGEGEQGKGKTRGTRTCEVSKVAGL